MLVVIQLQLQVGTERLILSLLFYCHPLTQNHIKKNFDY